MKKRLKTFKTIFILLIVLGGLLLHFYIPRVITEINNPLIALVKNTSIPRIEGSYDSSKSKGHLINFKSFDDIQLSAYLTYSVADTVQGTIILLHGIRGQKEHFIALSEKLSARGFNTVALDLRAHGQSRGLHCTFGVKEKNDVKSLIDFLIEKKGIKDRFGVWGQSLGGAIGLQTMGVDKRITFGIIESTFSDFRIITNDYFKYHLGFNVNFLTDYFVDRAGDIVGFDPNEARPIKYCTMIEQPILLVHGDKDKRINIQYAKDNYSNIKSEYKEFLEIKNANHLNIWKTGGDLYFEKVMDFIKKNTSVQDFCVAKSMTF